MFEGVFTAIVTPFSRDGSFDKKTMAALVEDQIAGGVDGIVPVGTTGESPTLSMREHNDVIETVVAAADGRVQVIAGTGGNSTSEALELTQYAKSVGATGTLQVTPYYNKPTAKGLVEHFAAVADVGLPVMLYNVPGRSGIEIPIEVVAELSQHEYVLAVKEAAGKVSRVNDTLDACDIKVLSGDDPLTLPMMIAGAVGVVSVASNVIPGVVSKMVHAALEGRWAEAAEIHREYVRFFSGMFMETNPIPVKTALAMLGKTTGTFRAPMCPISDGGMANLRDLLGAYGMVQELA